MHENNITAVFNIQQFHSQILLAEQHSKSADIYGAFTFYWNYCNYELRNQNFSNIPTLKMVNY